MFLIALSTFFFSYGAAADVSYCERVRAEAAELMTARPVACDESRETHDTYLKSFPKGFELCQKIESELSAGPVKLKLGSEDEMHREIVEIRQRHITERNEADEKVNRDLFPTPLDSNDLSKIPPEVSSECGTEIETHVRFRRALLQAISDMYLKIGAFDETLLDQASDRALPAPVVAPVKNVR